MRRGHLAVALALGAMPFAASPAEQLVARAPTGVTADAERLLASSAEPWRLQLRDGEDLVSTARLFCGRLTKTYKSLLFEANKAPRSDGKVVVPACFAVRPGAEVAVNPTESLAEVAWRSAGVAGPVTMSGIVNANPSLPTNVNLSLPLTSLGVDLKALKIPNATEAIAYDVRAGVDAGRLANQLAEKLKIPQGAAKGPDTTGMFKLESSVEPGTQNPVPCTQALAGRYASWPFKLDDVAKALARIDAARAERGKQSMKPGEIAIVDNGMDRIFEPEFPPEDFVLNDQEYRGSAGDDPDGNEYKDDEAGTNVFAGGQPVAFPASTDDPFHGTYMASLALGGPSYRSWQKINFPARRVKILAVSMVDRRTVPASGGPVTSYDLPVEGLRRALNYVLGRKVFTVNLSISTSERLRMVEEAIFNTDALLLVVAAGNEPYELNSRARYPASESPVERQYGGRVITVAAHDKSGCFAGFSGRGDMIVDLAAPGVDIEGVGLGGQRIFDEGTSQATALTSFVAALIRAGGDLTPSRVKDRLHASVDLSTDLAPYVKSGGALNVAKALSIYDDVLELKGTSGLLFGKIEGDRYPETFCPSLSGDDRVVLKVSRRVNDGDPLAIRLLLRNDANKGVLEEVHCAPSAAQFSFALLDGRKLQFKLSEVGDFVAGLVN